MPTSGVLRLEIPPSAFDSGRFAAYAKRPKPEEIRRRLHAREHDPGYGLLALLLSVVGLYGVTSIGVARRTREIGIRMALGATRRRVLSAVLRETLATSIIGIAAGVFGAMTATRLVAAFLFGVAPRDPVTLGAVVALLAGTALVAGFCRRVARRPSIRRARSEGSSSQQPTRHPYASR